MTSRLSEVFKDEKLIEKIKKRLPYLFQLAEIECSRAGKIGMQVGSLRENIIVALLIHKFGKENVETEIPITEPETDVKICGYPVSIKTITGFGGIKANWTVDPDTVKKFRETYTPKCDILLVLIKWKKLGNLFCIPREVQQKVLKDMGHENYILLPKPGTNPRGPEFNKEALLRLVRDPETRSIGIEWYRSDIKHKPYERWLPYWHSENFSYAKKTQTKLQ